MYILEKVSCLSMISINKAGLALDPSPVRVVRLLLRGMPKLYQLNSHVMLQTCLKSRLFALQVRFSF